MYALLETAVDLERQTDMIRRRRHGVIEIVDERLVGIHFRPWPKIVSIPEAIFLGERCHRLRQGNRCLAYFNQTRRFPNFLSLTYVVSTRDCTLASLRLAMDVLDEVARIKRSDAILCQAWNWRISDRFFRRWGWASHKPSRWRRHYIKRFYGDYPPPRELPLAGTLTEGC